jgi:hypothetical protein
MLWMPVYIVVPNLLSMISMLLTRWARVWPYKSHLIQSAEPKPVGCMRALCVLGCPFFAKQKDAKQSETKRK